MKRKVISAVSVLMIVMILMSLSACNETVADKVEEGKILLLLNDFQQACNDLDTDAMLDCLHPDIVNRIKPYLSLFENYTDKSLPELLFSAFMEASDNISDIDENFFSSLKFDLDSIKMTGENSAKVVISVTFVFKGAEVKRNANINCEKVDGKWYIKSFNIV